ncbi:MAG: EAL domain-containing protein [Campylobacterota bacterium]|nr:EAL domain-containing protein [Campylobacterota bacterium]
MQNNLYEHIIYDTGFVTKTDLKGDINFVNQNLCDISGYSKDEFLGKTHSFLKSDDTSSEIYKELWNTILQGDTWKGIFKNKTKSGKAFYMDTSIYPIKNKDNKIEEFVSFSTNLTQYIDLITYDNLTGLRNRDTFKNDIDSTKEYICIVINIDNFSDITEFYGGFIGDDVIKETAKRLLKVFKGSLVYRLQGDEFAILKQLPISYDSKIIEDMAKYKLKSIFDNVFNIEDIAIHITATSGISIGSSYCLRNANLAFKDAKSKNLTYSIYEDNLLEQFANFTMNKEIAGDIRKAIKDDLIVPYYQPIIDNKTGKIVKYEALARLIKDNNVVSPGEFLDISKKIKYYHKITRAMLKKSFKHFGINSDIGVSINITIEDIANIRTFNLIIDLLNKNKFNDNITFELVESDGIDDDQLFSRFVNTIKSYGAKISIDDFGTGYSNFSYLAKIEPDYLKIDGSLIKNIHNTKDFDVVKAIIDFAKMYDIKTVAEFVENEDIYILVKELGIDYSQGYYFGKPLPIDEV